VVGGMWHHYGAMFDSESGRHINLMANIINPDYCKV